MHQINVECKFNVFGKYNTFEIFRRLVLRWIMYEQTKMWFMSHIKAKLMKNLYCNEKSNTIQTESNLTLIVGWKVNNLF